MDYLSYFSFGNLKLEPAGSLSLAVGVLFFFKLTALNASYVAFITFLLFVYLGLLLLWLGFTLSFLIISIIYSTIFVIFWIFFISFSDSQEKREYETPGSWLLLALFGVVSLSGLWFQPVYPLSPALAVPTPLEVDASSSQLEFLTIFRLLYRGHGLLLTCFFLALLMACLSVVSLLTYKAAAQGEPHRTLSLKAWSKHAEAVLKNIRKAFFYSEHNKSVALNSFSS